PRRSSVLGSFPLLIVGFILCVYKPVLAQLYVPERGIALSIPKSRPDVSENGSDAHFSSPPSPPSNDLHSSAGSREDRPHRRTGPLRRGDGVLARRARLTAAVFGDSRVGLRSVLIRLGLQRLDPRLRLLRGIEPDHARTVVARGRGCLPPRRRHRSRCDRR